MLRRFTQVLQYDHMKTVNNRLDSLEATTTGYLTAQNGTTVQSVSFTKKGNTVQMTGWNYTYGGTVTSDLTIGSTTFLPKQIAPFLGKTLNGLNVFGYIDTAGHVVISGLSNITSASNYYFGCTYIC